MALVGKKHNTRFLLKSHHIFCAWSTSTVRLVMDLRYQYRQYLAQLAAGYHRMMAVNQALIANTVNDSNWNIVAHHARRNETVSPACNAHPGKHSTVL